MPPGIAERTLPLRHTLLTWGERRLHQRGEQAWSTFFANYDGRTRPEWYTPLSFANIVQKRRRQQIVLAITTSLQPTAHPQAMSLVGLRHGAKEVQRWGRKPTRHLHILFA